MKILIITVAFPPRNSPGAVRLYSWAKYWSRAGHQVTVLTTKKGGWDTSLTFSVTNDPVNPFEVCEVDHGLWRTPAPVPKAEGQSSGYSSKTLKLINDKLKQFMGPLLDPYLLYYAAAVKAGLRLAHHQDFDVMVSSFTPATCHWVARKLKQVLGIPWAADFRDLWGTDEVIPGVSGYPYLNRLLEKWAVTTADLLVTVSEPLRREFAKRYDIPCVTVENGFDPEEFALLDPNSIFPDDGKLRLVYTGAVYGKRNPAPLFAAVQALIQQGSLSPQGIELIFYGRNLEGVRELAQQYELADMVKVPGLVDRTTALRAQKSASGLIFLGWEDPSGDGFLTSKLFEYLRAGVPILGIGVSNHTSPGRLMEAAGLGYPLGIDVENIRSFILNNYINRKYPNIHPNWDLISNYSREKLAYKAIDYLGKVVYPRPVKT